LRPSQLLASTAIVAAGMIAGGVALPAVAVASPVCTGISDFICNGTGSTIPSAESLIPEDGPFSVLIGPDPELPFVQEVRSNTTAFTIDADGYSTHGDGIHMYAGSSIGFADGETGIGLAIKNPGEDVEATIDGASGGSAAASITGTTGILVTGEDGYVHLTNSGHVLGTQNYGIEVYGEDGGLAFDLDNDGSVVSEGTGLLTGIFVHGVQYTHINNNGSGVIAGFGGDGVYVADVTDGVSVSNTGGVIFGSGAGVYIADAGGEDGVTVNNTAGSIIGDGNAGIHVGNPEGIGGISQANVYNWAQLGDSTPTGGGHVIGQYQGIMLAARQVFVGNGPGGAILGSGYEGNEDGYGSTPIVELHSWYGAGVNNYGLIATSDSDRALPHFNWTHDFTLSDDNGAVVDAGYTLDTSAIAADVSQFGTFAWTGGQTGSLTRNGTSLADYGMAAQALAVQASGDTEDGLTPGGSANVTNKTSGILIGRVEMGVSNEDGASLQNFGTWYTQDQAETYYGFGYAAGLYSEDGYAGIDNAGLVQTAFAPSTQEAAHFIVPSGFRNGAYWSEEQDGPVASPGLLSAIDGGVGDGIYILNGPSEDGFGSYLHNGGRFHGSTGGALTSFIGLDANLAPGTVEDPMTDDWSDPSAWRSDRFAAGNVSGSTGLIINKVNTTSTNLIGDTVILAHANYVDGSEDGADPGCATDTCKAGDTFYIAPQSKGYVEVGGVGAVQDGAYAWFLHAVGTAPDPDYIVVSDWSPADVQIPGLVTGAQNIWYDTSGVVADHIYGNHFPQAGEGGGGADLPVGVAPPTVPAAKPAVSIWGKFSGDHFNRTTAVTETLGGVTSSINTSLVQDTFSLLGGADFQPNGDGDGIRAGAFAGVVGSSLSFSSYGATATYQGGTIGGYAAYTRNGFYVDAEAKIDALNMTYSGGGLTANAWSTSAGILANAGYRMQMGDAFIEPVVSASYVNTTIQNLGLSGATVSFSNGQSFRLGAGAKVGTTVQVNDEMSAELALQGKLWDELGPANKITITDGFGNSTSFSDNISGLFGEISASATVYNLDKSMSGFVTVADKFNGSFNNASIKGGIRKTF